MYAAGGAEGEEERESLFSQQHCKSCLNEAHQTHIFSFQAHYVLLALGNTRLHFSTMFWGLSFIFFIF